MKTRLNPIKAGFRDMSWGAPPAAGMSPLQKEFPQALVRSSDTLQIGPVPIERIVYLFKNGRFVSATAALASTDSRRLLEFLTLTWGPPDDSPEGASRWLPHAELKETGVAVLFPVTEPNHSALVVMEHEYFLDLTRKSAKDNGL